MSLLDCPSSCQIECLADKTTAHSSLAYLTLTVGERSEERQKSALYLYLDILRLFSLISGCTSGSGIIGVLLGVEAYGTISQ